MGTLVPWRALLFEFLLFTCVGNIQVTLTIQGTDGLNSDIFRSYMLNATFDSPQNALNFLDDTQLSVVLCGVNTYSDDHSGVCRVCNTCPTETYLSALCEPWHDTWCLPCTVCGPREIVQCECSVLSPDCYTGNRVCQHLIPTDVHLNVSLRSNTKLSTLQTQLVSIGLATGYIPWLESVTKESNITFDGLITTGTMTYNALFTIYDIYNTSTLQYISAQDAAFFQAGLVYTFGGFRRRLLGYTGSLVTAVGANTQCVQTTTCPQFQALGGSGSCSDNVCVPLPCPEGYTGNYAECLPCVANTYKDVPGNDTCTQCPNGGISPEGSNSSDACVVPTTSSTTPQPTTSTTPRLTTSTTRVQTSSSSIAPTTTTVESATTTPVEGTSVVLGGTSSSAQTSVGSTTSVHQGTTSVSPTDVPGTTQTPPPVLSTPTSTPQPASTPQTPSTTHSAPTTQTPSPPPTTSTPIPPPPPPPPPPGGSTYIYQVSTRSYVTVMNTIVHTQQQLDMNVVYAVSACIGFLAVLIIMKKNTVIVVQGADGRPKPVLPFKLVRYRR